MRRARPKSGIGVVDDRVASDAAIGRNKTLRPLRGRAAGAGECDGMCDSVFADASELDEAGHSLAGLEVSHGSAHRPVPHHQQPRSRRGNARDRATVPARETASAISSQGPTVVCLETRLDCAAYRPAVENPAVRVRRRRRVCRRHGSGSRCAAAHLSSQSGDNDGPHCAS